MEETEKVEEKEHKGSMTVAEAGRKGGETVRNERGREFYEAIGRKGGATVKAERGRAFYEEIGRKGGETVKAERGVKFYEEIGKKGGDRVKATRGPSFYEEIGRKGGQKVKRLIEEGKIRLIDVREPDEWTSGHIPQATHIPLPQIVNNPEATLEGDRDQPQVFVCAAGTRSAVASEVAAMLGYKEIYNLEGGTIAWIKSGNPVDR